MKVTIIVKEEHADILYKACIGEIDTTDLNFKVDWAPYSQYVKGFLTVQINYEMYIKLQDVSNSN